MQPCVLQPIRGTIRIGLLAVPKLLVQVFNDFFKGQKVSILPENITTIQAKNLSHKFIRCKLWQSDS